MAAKKKKTATVKAKTKKAATKKKVVAKKPAKKSAVKATKKVAKKVIKKPAAKKAAVKKPVAKAKKPVAKAAAKKVSVKKPAASKVQAVEVIETEAPTQLQLVAFDETEVIELDSGDDDESNEEALAEAREIFQKFDKDQNGYIDAGEFANLLEALGVEPTEEEVQAGLSAIDTNNSGRISWNEFATYWVSE